MNLNQKGNILIPQFNCNHCILNVKVSDVNKSEKCNIKRLKNKLKTFSKDHFFMSLFENIYDLENDICKQFQSFPTVHSGDNY